jgi:hypothetical protein
MAQPNGRPFGSPAGPNLPHGGAPAGPAPPLPHTGLWGGDDPLAQAGTSAMPGPWGQAGSLGGDQERPPRKRKKTGLIAGATIAVAVLAGGGVAAVLLTGKNGGTSAAAPEGGSPAVPAGPGGTAAPTSAAPSSPAGAADPASVAQALVSSINTRNTGQYARLLCTAPDRGQLDQLKADWDSDATLHASLTGSPAVSGTRATVTVALTYHGQSMTPDLNLKEQGSGWCADIPS